MRMMENNASGLDVRLRPPTAPAVQKGRQRKSHLCDGKDKDCRPPEFALLDRRGTRHAGHTRQSLRPFRVSCHREMQKGPIPCVSGTLVYTDIAAESLEHGSIGDVGLELRCLDYFRDGCEPLVVHDAAKWGLADRALANELVTVAP